MGAKYRVFIWLSFAIILIVLLAIFWRELALFMSRIGVTVLFVVVAFVVGWFLGYANARGRNRGKGGRC